MSLRNSKSLIWSWGRLTRSLSLRGRHGTKSARSPPITPNHSQSRALGPDHENFANHAESRRITRARPKSRSTLPIWTRKRVPAHPNHAQSRAITRWTRGPPPQYTPITPNHAQSRARLVAQTVEMHEPKPSYACNVYASVCTQLGGIHARAHTHTRPNCNCKFSGSPAGSQSFLAEIIIRVGN